MLVGVSFVPRGWEGLLLDSLLLLGQRKGDYWGLWFAWL